MTPEEFAQKDSRYDELQALKNEGKASESDLAEYDLLQAELLAAMREEKSKTSDDDKFAQQCERLLTDSLRKLRARGDARQFFGNDLRRWFVQGDAGPEWHSGDQTIEQGIKAALPPELLQQPASPSARLARDLAQAKEELAEAKGAASRSGGDVSLMLLYRRAKAKYDALQAEADAIEERNEPKAAPKVATAQQLARLATCRASYEASKQKAERLVRQFGTQNREATAEMSRCAKLRLELSAIQRELA